MDIAGQVVLITGASTGIGANTAEYLSAFKVKLSLVARSKDKLADVKARCIAKGLLKDEDILLVEADLEKTDDYPRIVRSTVDAFGRLDHLINNAAFLGLEDVQHSTLGTFERVINVNLRAPLFLSKEAIPHLKVTKGSIVNISSLNSEIADSRCVVYSLSKTALEHLTRTTALEIAGDGVRVNAVVPGFVLTDTLLHGIPEDKRAMAESTWREQTLQKQPLGGALYMNQVSSVIHFLLTPAASAITGESIRVDNGGHLALPPTAGGMSQKFQSLANTGVVNGVPTQVRLAKSESNSEERVLE